jgi:hypothetical protein
MAAAGPATYCPKSRTLMFFNGNIKLAGLVEAHDREIQIVGTLTNLQDVFHSPHKLRIRLGRNAPDCFPLLETESNPEKGISHNPNNPSIED